jgi:hypothetical protein
MPAVDVIAGARRPPDELLVFDGLYGRDPATGDPTQGLETIDRWLAERLAQEPTQFRLADAFQKATPFRGQRPELACTRVAA